MIAEEKLFSQQLYYLFFHLLKLFLLKTDLYPGDLPFLVDDIHAGVPVDLVLHVYFRPGEDDIVGDLSFFQEPLEIGHAAGLVVHGVKTEDLQPLVLVFPIKFRKGRYRFHTGRTVGIPEIDNDDILADEVLQGKRLSGRIVFPGDERGFFAGMQHLLQAGGLRPVVPVFHRVGRQQCRLFLFKLREVCLIKGIVRKEEFIHEPAFPTALLQACKERDQCLFVEQV